MPTYEVTARKTRTLNNGLTTLLNEDLDLFFSLRLSTIQEAVEPVLKPIQKTLKAHDKKFRATDDDGHPIPIKRGGQVIGNMVDPAKADEATEAEEKILDKKLKFICPDILWKDLIHAQDKDNVPIPGWVLTALKPLLNTEGVDLTKAGEPKKDTKGKGKKGTPKPRGRAATKKAEEEETPEE